MDSLVSYLSRCPVRTSLPSSINDLMKGIPSGKYNLDSQIKTLLMDYWKSIGKRIKGYRDQVNHKAIILSNCIVFNTPKGFGLKMLLPDNPEERSPSKISYDPGIGTMGFLLESLKVTVQLINRLVERMINLMAGDDKNSRERAIVGLTIRGAQLKIGLLRTGEPVPYPVDVRRAVEMAFEEM